jgi:hypothetical protein
MRTKNKENGVISSMPIGDMYGIVHLCLVCRRCCYLPFTLTSYSYYMYMKMASSGNHNHMTNNSGQIIGKGKGRKDVVSIDMPSDSESLLGTATSGSTSSVNDELIVYTQLPLTLLAAYSLIIY